MDEHLLDWLLEPSDPSVRYRTLTELLGRPAEDSEVQEARGRLLEDQDVQRILSRLGPDGRWEHTTRNYSGFTTGYFLILLGELVPGGAHTPLHARIWPTIDAFLETVTGNRSDYCQGDLCLSLPVLRSLLMMGYWDDDRIQGWLVRLEHNILEDGARLCRQYDKHFVLKENSSSTCHRANTKALLLYAALPPERHRSSGAQKLAGYFLDRQVIGGLDEKEFQRHTTNLFPQEIWETPLFMVLHALAILGYGGLPETTSAWTLLETKKDNQGRYILEKVNSKPLLIGSKKGQPSKWVTFYTLLAHKVSSPQS